MKHVNLIFLSLSLMLLLVCAQQVQAVDSPESKTVIFITDDDNDNPQIEFLQRQGLVVEKFYPGALSEATQETIDYLNSADLIIIGRSPGSGDFGDPNKTVWNALTAPIISNNQYGTRSSRINWFNSTSAVHDDTGPNPINTFVNLPSDEIFEFATLTAEDSVDMYIPPHDYFKLTTGTQTNAEIVASKGEIIMIARFAADVEFYTGSVDKPAGPRTYFGFGNDNVYADEAKTTKVFNYFPLTTNAKHIYVAEIFRMLGLMIVPANVGPADKKIIFITDDDYDNDQIAFLKRQGYKVEVFWPKPLSTAGVDTISYLNRADLIIIGRSPISSTWTAVEDKQAWNALTAPIMSNNQYGTRSNRINWFNSTSAFHQDAGPNPFNGFVESKNDPIFEFTTLTAEDSIPLFIPPHDLFKLATGTQTNADLVITQGENVVLARFEQGVEFYTGSVDMPAGPRTYFGFGNDNTFVDEAKTIQIFNYFPLTDQAKHIYAAELSRMLGLPIKPAILSAEDRNVILVTDNENDDEQFDFLVSQGFKVEKFWPKVLSTVSQDTLDILNNADLVIIGRSPKSSTWTAVEDKQAWNALTVPVISNNQYGTRSSRLNWFNSTSAIHQNDGPNPFNAYIDLADDPIFKFANIDANDSLDMFIPPHDFFKLATGTQTNAEIVATQGEIVVIARFTENVEFYTGSVDMPAGPRTYFGFGNDDTGAFNYFPLTDNAKNVYVAELQRMLGLPITPVRRIEENNTDNTILFVHVATNIDASNGGSAPRDQPFIDKLVSQGYVVNETYAANLSFLSEEELAAYNEVGLVIIGRSGASGDFRDANKKAWNRIKTPVMNMSPFAVRSNRLNWFNSEDAAAGGLTPPEYALDSVTTAHVLLPDDPAFAGVEIVDGNVSWFTGLYRTLYMTDEAYSASNADILAVIEATATSANTTDDALLMARFQTGKPFYLDALDSAAAPRSYFGVGSDDTTYYTLSGKAEMIWLNEVANLLSMEYEPLEFLSPNAGLSNLTTGGSTVSEFLPGKFEYSVVLASSDIPVVGATAIHANATAVVVQATALPGDATVTVTAEDGTVLVYTVSFEAPSDDIRILFIGDDAETTAGVPDDAIIARLEALQVKQDGQTKNVKVVYMNDDPYKATPPNHAEFNMVFFSESMSSQAISAFKLAGNPLPAVIMEAFAMNSGSDRLDIGEGVNQGTDPNFLLAKDMKIVDVTHPITAEGYESNQVVNMGSDELRAQSITIKPEYDPVYLGDLAGNDFAPGLHTWAAIEPTETLNHRMVFFIQFDGRATTATEDYWNMLERSVLWVLDALETEGVFTKTDLNDDRIGLYPNPIHDQLNIEIDLEKEGHVAISVINLNGQIMKSVDSGFRNEGKNRIQVDFNGLKKGIYVVKVANEGRIHFGKVVID